MFRFLGIAFLAALYGVFYDISAITGAVVGAFKEYPSAVVATLAHPWAPVVVKAPPVDVMAPYRPFTRAKALAILRFVGPGYGLTFESVTGLHHGAAVGHDKTVIAAVRYRYRTCERAGEASFIGGDDIEFYWRLRDATELQKLQGCQ